MEVDRFCPGSVRRPSGQLFAYLHVLQNSAHTCGPRLASLSLSLSFSLPLSRERAIYSAHLGTPAKTEKLNEEVFVFFFVGGSQTHTPPTDRGIVSVRERKKEGTHTFGGLLYGSHSRPESPPFFTLIFVCSCCARALEPKSPFFILTHALTRSSFSLSLSFVTGIVRTTHVLRLSPAPEKERKKEKVPARKRLSFFLLARQSRRLNVLVRECRS